MYLSHSSSSVFLHFIAAYFKSQITKKVDLFNKLNPFQEIIHLLVPVLLQSGRNWPKLQLTQFSSVAQSCPTLCDPMDCSTPGFPAAAAAAAKSLQLCLTLCDPIDSSPPGSPVPGTLQARTLEWVPGFLVHHQLPELTQTCIHRVGDAIQPSRSLSSPSPHAFNLSQYQDLFQ